MFFFFSPQAAGGGVIPLAFVAIDSVREAALCSQRYVDQSIDPN